jgi:hypothetical protein
MKRVKSIIPVLPLVAVLAVLTGCSSIQENSHAYLGTGHYSPVQPTQVAILTEEPKQPKEKIGEVRLVVSGSPVREKIEKRLRDAAAKMGADAVFIVYDKMHVFPVTYVDWWGPSSTDLSMERNIVGIAVKYK